MVSGFTENKKMTHQNVSELKKALVAIKLLLKGKGFGLRFHFCNGQNTTFLIRFTLLILFKQTYIKHLFAKKYV